MQRPQTPIVRISDYVKSKSEQSQNKDYILKNFSNFMKEVIEKENKPFLNGDKSIIQYILSKYLNIPENDLLSLTKLSILINNDYGLLNQFATYLPSLKILKLNNSNILSINNIGTNFTNILCLQMKNCHLKDINGIICMQKLEIIDFEENQISDLTDIDMCSELKKINLKNNKISDSDNLTFLSNLDNLNYLDLRENPICENEKFKDLIENYFANLKENFIMKNDDE